MEKIILFSNDTNVEKVLYVDGQHNEHDEANSKIASAFWLAYILVIVILLVLIGATELKWWIILLIGLAMISAVTVCRVLFISMGENTVQDTHVLNEHFQWHYDFYDDRFTAEMNGERAEVLYADITKVNDTGSSYQIRADKNYTIKKSGFSPADEQQFVTMLRQYPAGMFLMNVSREEKAEQKPSED
ncbi:MAG: YcxB family protein [Ruminococcus sp.]|nr:YcxB family protein [Ruminococcus sp.]MBR2305513.1 YcxB family protein [Ruminococcus sp.]